jgi:hypothetical protein
MSPRLVSWSDDLASILAVLKDIERELVALGDPELAEVVGAVETAFPGARMVEVRRQVVLQ